jgi:hypothetical protein
MMGILKPKTKKWGFDAIVPVTGLDLEFRDYRNSLAIGTSGAKQNTTTPQLLLLALGMKKKGDMNHKSTLMVLNRYNFSAESQQEYWDARISLKHSLRRKQWEAEIGTGWVNRVQKNFSNQSRRDDRIEFDLGIAHYFPKDRQVLKFNFGYEDQKSDFSSYVYDNRSMGLSFKAKF